MIIMILSYALYNGPWMTKSVFQKIPFLETVIRLWAFDMFIHLRFMAYIPWFFWGGGGMQPLRKWENVSYLFRFLMIWRSFLKIANFTMSNHKLSGGGSKISENCKLIYEWPLSDILNDLSNSNMFFQKLAIFWNPLNN